MYSDRAICDQCLSLIIEVEVQTGVPSVDDDIKATR